MAWGFWHVALDDDSIEKSAFTTHNRQYEWLVMPVGLKNAPATFQSIMERVLAKFVGNNVEIYLDDVLIQRETR